VERSGLSAFEVVSKVVVERRSIRACTHEVLSREVIKRVLEVARWSPSGDCS
jgi:nitroreductase